MFPDQWVCPVLHVELIAARIQHEYLTYQGQQIFE